MSQVPGLNSRDVTFGEYLPILWKASVEFLLSVLELLFLSLMVEALQGKMCQNSLPSGRGGSFSATISGEGAVPLPTY